ncbi:MAG: beta-ribofuranosylaminobenzene 5'-phosphate synthase family protein [Ignavibacteria bacterium]
MIENIKVYVKTPARLHLGLIDLNGDMGRIFGGLGVAIDHPNVILEAQKSQTLTISGEKTELTQNLATKFMETYKIKEKFAIDVKRVIPEHIGLGSGTQLALAIAASISRLFGLTTSPSEWAVAMGRTAQSGVGTGVFEQGGLVVEAGKNTQNPSCQIIPIICRQHFPEEWRFVIAIPNEKKGLSKQAETNAFKKLPPMPAQDAGKICRLTMMKLLPAVAEKDIENFGEALTQIQNIVGDSFAKAQGGRFASSPAAKTVGFMLKNGAYGGGQSSWGPTVYGVVKSAEAQDLQVKTKAFLESEVGGDVFVAKADNHGAVIRVVKT